MSKAPITSMSVASSPIGPFTGITRNFVTYRNSNGRHGLIKYLLFIVNRLYNDKYYDKYAAELRLGNGIDFKLLHPARALTPMAVAPSGIVTEVTVFLSPSYLYSIAFSIIFLFIAGSTEMHSS